ncbi:MAG TPA: phenylalanine--tRNA ligase beta subunit-related protein [Castellaniella sp.]|nr:phenylalanine--tRNA ligase beta subunit-related protein [Castellaniella sp.]
MPFPFFYTSDIRVRFPQLRSGVFLLEGVNAKADATPEISRFRGIADQRLAVSSETEFAEIQAWRRAFSTMGIKPTQYRCASEALLRRYRKEGTLPALHPLIDLCNAASLAFAIPIAVFDANKITGSLTVRLACGDETYETFSGETEHPDPGEIIFSDESGRAHARRWTNRQSGLSAIRADTNSALIVAEALHDTADRDVASLVSGLGKALRTTWPTCVLKAVEPR